MLNLVVLIVMKKNSLQYKSFSLFFYVITRYKLFIYSNYYLLEGFTMTDLVLTIKYYLLFLCHVFITLNF